MSVQPEVKKVVNCMELLIAGAKRETNKVKRSGFLVRFSDMVLVSAYLMPASSELNKEIERIQAEWNAFSEMEAAQ
jgi:hypothetical protein